MPETNNITLHDFLYHETRALELCAIRKGGWTIFTCWIDHEDLWKIPAEYNKYIVRNHEWKALTITDQNGKNQDIPCHFIDI